MFKNWTPSCHINFKFPPLFLFGNIYIYNNPFMLMPVISFKCAEQRGLLYMGVHRFLAWEGTKHFVGMVQIWLFEQNRPLTYLILGPLQTLKIGGGDGCYDVMWVD